VEFSYIISGWEEECRSTQFVIEGGFSLPKDFSSLLRAFSPGLFIPKLKKSHYLPISGWEAGTEYDLFV
jgi:hypothetical protein